MGEAARRRTPATTHPLPRESVARADLPLLDLADVPLMGASGAPRVSANPATTRRRRTRHVNRDPAVLGGPDAPPAYTRIERPPEYSTHDSPATPWIQTGEGGQSESRRQGNVGLGLANNGDGTHEDIYRS